MKLTESKQQGQSSSNRKPMIGYFSGPCISYNPTKSELEKIYGRELEKDPEYTGSKNDNDWAMHKFIFKDAITNEIIEHPVFIKNELCEWDGEDGHKKEFVNCVGDTQVRDDVKNLTEAFQNFKDKEKGITGPKNARQAKEGEGDLYTLLKFLLKFDKWNPETDLFIPFKELMKGTSKELKEIIKTGNTNPVMGLLQVRSKDGENGQIFHEQSCIARSWCFGWDVKKANVRSQSNTWEQLDAQLEKGMKDPDYDLRQFRYWGNRSKNIVKFAPLAEFDPNENIASTNESLRHSNDDEPVTMEY